MKKKKNAFRSRKRPPSEVLLARVYVYESRSSASHSLINLRNTRCRAKGSCYCRQDCADKIYDCLCLFLSHNYA